MGTTGCKLLVWLVSQVLLVLLVLLLLVWNLSGEAAFGDSERHDEPVPTLRFWKPYDVLSKFTDGEGRATLADFIDLSGVYGAGRLDRDSEGLLIVSDDASLRTTLTDPDHHVPRTYWVQVERIPDNAALGKLRSGVVVKGRSTRPAQVRLLDEPPDVAEREVPIRVRKSVPDCWLELTLTEGRNRQVRRMTAAVGHPTLRLIRCRIGSIGLDGLTPGGWEHLSAAQLAELNRGKFSTTGTSSKTRGRPSRRTRR